MGQQPLQLAPERHSQLVVREGTILLIACHRFLLELARRLQEEPVHRVKAMVEEVEEVGIGAEEVAPMEAVVGVGPAIVHPRR